MRPWTAQKQFAAITLTNYCTRQFSYREIAINPLTAGEPEHKIAYENHRRKKKHNQRIAVITHFVVFFYRWSDIDLNYHQNLIWFEKITEFRYKKSKFILHGRSAPMLVVGQGADLSDRILGDAWLVPSGFSVGHGAQNTMEHHQADRRRCIVPWIQCNDAKLQRSLPCTDMCKCWEILGSHSKF